MAHANRSAPVLLLFGPPGSGKNFVGEFLATHIGFTFFDADAWLPEDLEASLARGEGFTQEQRDRYYAEVASRISEITSRLQGEARIVVAQAVIKNRHRRLLLGACPCVRLCWVRSTEEDRRRRLCAGNNLVNARLGAHMASEFEEPDHEHLTFSNSDSTDADTMRELLERLVSQLYD